MKKPDNKRPIAIGSVILAAVVAGMIAYLVLKCDYKSIFAAVGKADVKFIVPAVMCILVFMVCESLNIRRVCRWLGYDISMARYIKYSAAGFFFSSITPSSTGGQPMQLYYMYSDGIGLAHSSLALLTELLGFQIASIGLAAFGIIYNNAYLSDLSGGIRLLLGGGMIISFIILLLLVAVIFVPPAAALIEKKFPSKMKDYRNGSAYIRKNPGILVRNTMTSVFQLMALYSITYFAYLALGLTGYGWLQIFSLQAVVSAGVSVVPVPGTAGAAEGGFKVIFASVFGSMIMPGVVISRGISLYLGIVITGLVLMILLLSDPKRREGHSGLRRLYVRYQDETHVQ